ncbi:hypothetical protein DFP72DRAFT_634102 [Ephemerocybe angulata]|uniref:Oxidase ustYa n=1 Tax=Ephemerocybe angulata TaxID=980116 RepID=A0A8H6LXL8_9AGAR|nr:hypothetical protein DFP72DRAFT_634102 [Tulosesus angulatus]
MVSWVPRAIIALSLVNMALIAIRMGSRQAECRGQPGRTSHTYTYVGDDYPSHLPTNLTWEDMVVDMVVEESTRFTTTHQNLPNWRAVIPGYPGYIRLGPFPKRVFALPIYHQLHCLYELAKVLARSDPDAPGPKPVIDWHASHHTQHCLTYLRQQILCAADETLEDSSWMCGSYDGTRSAKKARKCKDWSHSFRKVQEVDDAWWSDEMNSV